MVMVGCVCAMPLTRVRTKPWVTYQKKNRKQKASAEVAQEIAQENNFVTELNVVITE